MAKRVNIRGVKAPRCCQDSTSDSSGLQPRGRTGASGCSTPGAARFGIYIGTWVCRTLTPPSERWGKNHETIWGSGTLLPLFSPPSAAKWLRGLGWGGRKGVPPAAPSPSHPAAGATCAHGNEHSSVPAPERGAAVTPPPSPCRAPVRQHPGMPGPAGEHWLPSPACPTAPSLPPVPRTRVTEAAASSPPLHPLWGSDGTARARCGCCCSRKGPCRPSSSR